MKKIARWDASCRRLASLFSRATDFAGELRESELKGTLQRNELAITLARTAQRNMAQNSVGGNRRLGYRVRMIVVMHHDADFRKCLVRCLQRAGFDAAGFAEGAEALAAMRRQKPRLLILNGTLSDMDGIELLSMVRADAGLADLPVGFMSGNDKRQPEAERLGISAYFLKPFGLDVFIHFVEGTLAAARMNDNIAQEATKPPGMLAR